MKQKILLRKKAKNLEPILRIGKNKLTENVIKELNKLLEKRHLIKVRLLKCPIKENKKEFINEILSKTNSELIEVVGNVIVLYRN